MIKVSKKGFMTILLSLLVLIVIIVIGNQHLNNRTNNLMDANTIEIEELVFDDKKIFINHLNNEMKIYMKSSAGDDRYLGYIFSHFQKELDRDRVDSNYDVWRLNGVNEYKRIGNKDFKFQREIVTSGEWELAIEEVGANDFIGGSVHGDEINTFVSLKVDGEEKEIGKYLNTEADNVVIKVESDLFRDNTMITDLEKVATHNKTYTFNAEGLVLEQEVIFDESLQINRSFLGMLPIIRNKNGEQITDTFIINDEETKHDVSGEDERETFQANKVTIFGEDSGVSATVEILDRSHNISNNFYVSRSSDYNKLYFTFANNGYITDVGEVWKQKTKYEIDIVE